MVQFIGLNDRAKTLVTVEPILNYTDFILRKFPDGKEENIIVPVYKSPIEIRQGKEFYTDFSDCEVYLDDYIFPDGKTYHEYVQNTIWSSGPVIFTAFKEDDGSIIEESLWTEQEMESQL
jgi:hypothetical protein